MGPFQKSQFQRKAKGDGEGDTGRAPLWGRRPGARAQAFPQLEGISPAPPPAFSLFFILFLGGFPRLRGALRCLQTAQPEHSPGQSPRTGSSAMGKSIPSATVSPPQAASRGPRTPPASFNPPSFPPQALSSPLHHQPPVQRPPAPLTQPCRLPGALQGRVFQQRQRRSRANADGGADTGTHVPGRRGWERSPHCLEPASATPFSCSLGAPAPQEAGAASP